MTDEVKTISATHATDMKVIAAYDPSATEMDADCERSFQPFTANDGACQRSIQVFAKLLSATDKATHVKWDQMLDLGAIHNYMAAALFQQIAKACGAGPKIEGATIVECDLYKEAQRINGADPEAPNGMHCIAWAKIKLDMQTSDRSIYTQIIRVDVLNRSLVHDLRGALQQSMDEGMTDIHNQTSSPHMRPEWYRIRMAASSSHPGEVKIPRPEIR